MRLIPFLLCASITCISSGFSDFNLFKNMNWLKKGFWTGPNLEKSKKIPYFTFQDRSIYAIQDTARVSMDIKNIEVTNQDTIRFKMNNFKVHSAPMSLSIVDYRIFRFIQLLTQHGLVFEIPPLNNGNLTVAWSITDNKKTFQQGNIVLSNQDFDEEIFFRCD